VRIEERVGTMSWKGEPLGIYPVSDIGQNSDLATWQMDTN
jgi:hypothetical protein